MVLFSAKEITFDKFDKTKFSLSPDKYKKYCEKCNKLQKQKLDNKLQFNLPYIDRKIHKVLNKYFEKKYDKYRYGYPFIEKEVLRDQDGEYLLYDPDDDLFLEDNIAVIDMDRGCPNMKENILLCIG